MPDLLRARMAEKKHTQTAAAEACGVTQASFSRWLGGKPPGDAKLVTVVEYLGLPPDSPIFARELDRIDTAKRRRTAAAKRRLSIGAMAAKLTKLEDEVAAQRELLVEVLTLLNPGRAKKVERERVAALLRRAVEQ